VAPPDCSLTNIQPEVDWQRAGRFIHHVPWEYPPALKRY